VMNGHPPDKVELLVLGGTWTSYPHAYQVRVGGRVGVGVRVGVRVRVEVRVGVRVGVGVGVGVRVRHVDAARTPTK